MTSTIYDKNTKLSLLLELLENINQIYYWNFDSEAQLLSTNCKHLIVNTVFENAGLKKDLQEYSKSGSDPLILSAAPGLMWGAVFERDEVGLLQTHVIGPVLNSDISRATIDSYLDDPTIPRSWKTELFDTLQNLPVISTINFFPSVLMLHYSITGVKLIRSDIHYHNGKSPVLSKSKSVVKDRHQTFMVEQKLLQMVKDGNLNYQKALDNASTVSTGVGVRLGDPLVEAKLSGHSFITLCIRAAIEGGLSPEFAYSRGDAYTQSLMESKSLSEVVAINHVMYEDFIRCVHRHKVNPEISVHIQNCCDYIEMNLENTIHLQTLARRVGYTEYYLSRKFKKEIGITINDYIKNARIEQARILLTSTQESIQSISNRFKFCSRSYFSEVFKENTGQTPVEYRKMHQRI